jgi:hypothetical protein
VLVLLSLSLSLSLTHPSPTHTPTHTYAVAVLVLLSTVSDALEQVVCEVIVQEESVDVDVYTFAGVCGLIGRSSTASSTA